ncbi:D-alanyl-D-alanine carboxypeptidase [Gordonia sp. PDNC005]|uniref:D-alanyl-D-alanine carboxypeptidase family protein n=1 Tax=unclassified Gordonia (in: high G+C Gram-positive bacteria) TaxID=2657482 RepID=UPI0019654BF6|nr:D-alanyl-D-alanine carboxypeptidase family protein [Gordonia sp. PDNC005]QRY63466.1 D-alanyl-D-alanine carboxypeptidase [Gordonia sp. PDNC005]
MISRISRVGAAVAVAAASVLSAPVCVSYADPVAGVEGYVPAPTPDTDDCPHRVHTPPAIDESEAVQPGHTTPTALPVPTPAVGGAKLAGCGVVADPKAGDVPANLTSAGWLIADLDTGTVIAAKDPHGRYRPASTIKTLLALTAMKELNLDTVVTGTTDDYGIEGDSCGIGPGGTYTVRELLTGLLMVSGNDCANALARELGGRDQTLTKMNAEAKAIGAVDTRAASPSGLDAPGMSTSPFDLALIFREAMRNADFRHMISLTEFTFPGFPALKDVPGDKAHPGYMMATSNALLRDGYPGMLGGKTGFTDDALKTFVAGVERNGKRLVIVQMAGLTVAGDTYVQQAQRMIDYGFAAPAGTSVGSLAHRGDNAHSPFSPAPEPESAASDEPAHTGRTALIVIVTILAAVAASGGAVLRKRATRPGTD